MNNAIEKDDVKSYCFKHGYFYFLEYLNIKYIYIYREREREIYRYRYTYTYIIYIYVYVYIYIYTYIVVKHIVKHQISTTPTGTNFASIMLLWTN